ncbi:MAG: tetratricopeptide repeat protein [Myxococcota bacterium]
MTPEAGRFLAELREGYASMGRGNHKLATRRFKAARRGSPLIKGHALRALAELSIRSGEPTSAIAYLERSLAAYGRASQLEPATTHWADAGSLAALTLLGEVHQRLGRDEGVMVTWSNAEALASRLGEDVGADVLAVRGRLAFLRGDLDAAEACLHGAREGYQDATCPEGEAEVLIMCAEVAAARGDLQTVAQHLRAAQRMLVATTHPVLLARVLLGLADVSDDVREAETLSRRSFELAQAGRDATTVAFALLGISRRALARGATEERVVLGAAQILLDQHHLPGLGLAMVLLADSALLTRDADVALVACEVGWRRMGPSASSPELRRMVGLVAEALHLNGARDVAAEAASWWRQLGGIETGQQTSDTERSGGDEVDLEGQQRVRREVQSLVLEVLTRRGLDATRLDSDQGSLDVISSLAGHASVTCARSFLQWAPEPDVSLTDITPVMLDGESQDRTARIRMMPTPGVRRSRAGDGDGRLVAWVASHSGQEGMGSTDSEGSVSHVDDAPPEPLAALSAFDPAMPEEEITFDAMAVLEGLIGMEGSPLDPPEVPPAAFVVEDDEDRPLGES